MEEWLVAENGQKAMNASYTCYGALNCMHDQKIAMETRGDEMYRIRRIIPLECCRLQGFPDDWCKGLINRDPSQEDLEFWDKVFKTWGKPKNEKYIRKWLGNPHTDSDEYKMWGNGVGLPCVEYIMECCKEILEGESK